MRKVEIVAEASGDIPNEIIEKYNVHQVYGKVTIAGTEYIDKINISPMQMFELTRATKALPKTSAINIDTYLDAFIPLIDEGKEIVVITLSNQISMGYHNALVAAKEREGIYVVDSLSLSSGLALLVIEAGEMADKGCSGKEIYEALLKLREKVRVTFVLNTLEYMAAGGRCSAVTAFGANILGIKPCIEMDRDGKLEVVKKYRGNMMKVLPAYVRDQLSSKKEVRKDKIFITYSSAAPEIIETVRNAIVRIAEFDNIYETTASCIISTHCGPGTIGILFMEE